MTANNAAATRRGGAAARGCSVAGSAMTVHRHDLLGAAAGSTRPAGRAPPPRPSSGGDRADPPSQPSKSMPMAWSRLHPPGPTVATAQATTPIDARTPSPSLEDEEAVLAVGRPARHEHHADHPGGRERGEQAERRTAARRRSRSPRRARAWQRRPAHPDRLRTTGRSRRAAHRRTPCCSRGRRGTPRTRGAARAARVRLVHAPRRYRLVASEALAGRHVGVTATEPRPAALPRHPPRGAGSTALRRALSDARGRWCALHRRPFFIAVARRRRCSRCARCASSVAVQLGHRQRDRARGSRRATVAAGDRRRRRRADHRHRRGAGGRGRRAADVGRHRRSGGSPTRSAAERRRPPRAPADVVARPPTRRRPRRPRRRRHRRRRRRCSARSRSPPATVLLIVVSAVWLLATDLVLGAVAVARVPAAHRRSTSSTSSASTRYYDTRPGRSSAQLSAGVHESFDGVQLVKAYGAEERETERLVGDRRPAAQRPDRRGPAARHVRGAARRAARRSPTSASCWSARCACSSGDMTVGELASFIYLFTLLVFPLRLIGFALSELPHSFAGWDRVREVLDEPIEPDPADAIAVAAAGTRDRSSTTSRSRSPATTAPCCTTSSLRRRRRAHRRRRRADRRRQDARSSS